MNADKQMEPETFSFKAEVEQLMQIIINSLYSNKDIFLRELISNSSDAINKLKHDSLTKPELLGGNFDFQIKLQIDKDLNTITVEDSGVGMTKDDLINNLGTIAKSGTKEFIKKFTENASNSNLIGQFGVGFYSAFLVSDRVEVKTKFAGSDKTFKWESSANGQFKVEQVENDPTLQRGTRITLHVKDSEKKYIDEFKLKEIVKKHSAYVTYPILLYKLEKVEEEPSEDTSKKVEEVEEVVEGEGKTEVVEDVVEDVKEPKVETEGVEETKTEKVEKFREVWEKINSEPLWSKSSNEITDKDYEDFYKSLTGDWDTYETNKLFKMEGTNEFTGLLFIPKQAPTDLFDRSKTKSSIKLYVRKVLISDDCKEMYPEWMGFVKGIVDSQDIPLNVSRELLQQSKIIKQINKTLVSKVLEMINGLTEDSEKYKRFYTNFDKNLKLGICEDKNESTKDKLKTLLRFTTSKGTFVSLDEYKERMKENQKGIYYITGESLSMVENSPFVDKLKRLDYEVIYMTDPIDEYTIQNIPMYKEVRLLNVVKDDLKLDGDDTKKNEEKFKEFCSRMQKLLGEDIEKVYISNKIESQPAIVTNPMGISANMERIWKAQALASNTNPMQNMMYTRRNLEINPTHHVIEKLYSKFQEEGETLSEPTLKLVRFVYDCALMAGGYHLTDVNTYLKTVFEYM
jgi:molecular chaperone HtpG